jgi:hypothetical protein
MPVQVKRLLLLFGVIVLFFLLARHYLTPDTFGQYGHYRGASLKENADKPIRYVNMKETCVVCHDSIAAVKDSSVHRFINCQTCHGPGYLHADNPTKENITKPHLREFCGTCHSKNPARAKVIKQIDMDEHNPGDECISCHNSHNPVLW